MKKGTIGLLGMIFVMFALWKVRGWLWCKPTRMDSDVSGTPIGPKRVLPESNRWESRGRRSEQRKGYVSSGAIEKMMPVARDFSSKLGLDWQEELRMALQVYGEHPREYWEGFQAALGTIGAILEHIICPAGDSVRFKGDVREIAATLDTEMGNVMLAASSILLETRKEEPRGRGYASRGTMEETIAFHEKYVCLSELKEALLQDFDQHTQGEYWEGFVYAVGGQSHLLGSLFNMMTNLSIPIQETEVSCADFVLRFFILEGLLGEHLLKLRGEEV